MKIRAGRKVPGLQKQHRCGLRLVAVMAGASLTGAALHATEITVEAPAAGTLLAAVGAFEANSQGAGSTMLLLQISLPLMIFAVAERTQLVLLGTGSAANLLAASSHRISHFPRISPRSRMVCSQIRADSLTPSSCPTETPTRTL